MAYFENTCSGEYMSLKSTEPLHFECLPGRFRMVQYFPDGFAGNTELTDDFTLAHITMMTGQSNFVVNLH
jgi:hypothetical protein